MRSVDIWDAYFELPQKPPVMEIEAVACQLRTRNMIWATGLGKSGLVAQKFVGTLRSLKQPAAFIHPVEAFHGDVGSLRHMDGLVAISASGETREVIELARYAYNHGLHVTAATSADPGFDGNIHEYADDWVYTADPSWDPGHIPTASFVTACCALDMLAVAIVGDRRRIHHPGGSIGRKLSS